MISKQSRAFKAICKIAQDMQPIGAEDFKRYYAVPNTVPNMVVAAGNATKSIADSKGDSVLYPLVTGAKKAYDSVVGGIDTVKNYAKGVGDTAKDIYDTAVGKATEAAQGNPGKFMDRVGDTYAAFNPEMRNWFPKTQNFITKQMVHSDLQRRMNPQYTQRAVASTAQPKAEVTMAAPSGQEIAAARNTRQQRMVQTPQPAPAVDTRMAVKR